MTLRQGSFNGCMALSGVALYRGDIPEGEDPFSRCRNLEKAIFTRAFLLSGSNAFKDCRRIVIAAPRGSDAENFAKQRKLCVEPLDT